MPRRLAYVSCLALALAAVVAPPATVAAPADTITVVQRQIDVNPGETNPCTGATGTIIDDEQDVFHVTSLADGRLRLNGHSTVNVTFLPDDPDGVRYQGHETFAFSENSASATFTTTMTTMVRVKGTDGTFLTFRDVAHMTVTKTGVVVALDRPTLICP